MPLFLSGLKFKLDIFIFFDKLLDIFIETKYLYNPKSYIAKSELISGKIIWSLKQMIWVSFLYFCTTIIQLEGEELIFPTVHILWQILVIVNRRWKHRIYKI